VGCATADYLPCGKSTPPPIAHIITSALAGFVILSLHQLPRLYGLCQRHTSLSFHLVSVCVISLRGWEDFTPRAASFGSTEMDETELQNANPSVLTLDQLPTRRRRNKQASSRGPESRFDDILSMKGSHVTWGPVQAISPWPMDGPDGEDEFAETCIDELEIYGKSLALRDSLLR
jgi:hypothetical protein